MGGSLDQMPNYTFSDLTLQLLPKYIFYGSLMIFFNHEIKYAYTCSKTHELLE